MKFIKKAKLYFTRWLAGIIISDEMVVHRTVAFSVIAFDAIATVIFIRLGTVDGVSPVMLKLMETFGVWEPLLVRQLITAWITTHPKVNKIMLISISLIYSIIAFAHVFIFLRHAFH